MERPLVSVVIATYNRIESLVKTLASVKMQDYPHLEIIIVNDASTDATKEVLQKMENIILINNAHNLNLVKSLNIGCKQARGKYIARIDDHDLWVDKSKLSKQVKFLEEHKDIAVVGTGYEVLNKPIVNPLIDQDIRNQILFRCPLSHVTVLMRRDILRKVGGYNESLPYSEDWDLWLKIGKSYQLANLGNVTTVLGVASDSKSQQYFLKQWSTNWSLLGQYSSFYPKRIRAYLYHLFIRLFFFIFKPGTTSHIVAQKIFKKVFLSS